MMVPRHLPRSGIYLPPEVLDSTAFLDLNASQIRLLLDFLSKRHINRKQKQKKLGWSLVNGVTNNGSITYTHSEAKARGYSSSTFQRALDGLIDHGFLDVHHPLEVGTVNDRRRDLDGHLGSRYSISDRWRKWNTPEFEERSRKRAVRNGPGAGRPFEQGNQLGGRRSPTGATRTGTDGKS